MNQWLKVRDASGKEGFVAAWYVKYASGSTAQAAAAPTVMGGPLTVRATAEAVVLRRQPVISDATLIKRLPLGTAFTVTELNAENKIGPTTNGWQLKIQVGLKVS